MLDILICDGMDKKCIETLKEKGYRVKDYHYDRNDLINEIKNYSVVVIRSATKLDKDVIEAGASGNLKLIIRAGVGIDNIDINYAKVNGIDVRNTPNASSVSVAELTIAHMFGLTRYVHNANLTMRQGRWEKKNYKGIELFGKTLGLIGFGRIAREVAIRAEAIGMKVIYTEKLGIVRGYERFEFCSLEELLKSSDFVSLHIPFNKQDGAIIGEKELNIMKQEAYIINCARGGLIDEEALVNALESGKISGAGLDVFESEPNPNEKLLNNDKVSVTPHIGGSTKEAQIRIGEEVIEIIENYFSIQDLNVVNL